MSREGGLPCPCGCGQLNKDGRYVRGHKPKKGASKANGAAGNAELMLKVEADEKLCEQMFKRLTLRQKVAALNSLDR